MTIITSSLNESHSLALLSTRRDVPPPPSKAARTAAAAKTKTCCTLYTICLRFTLARSVCVDAAAAAVGAAIVAAFAFAFGQLAEKKGVNEIENIFVVSVSFITYARQHAKAQSSSKSKTQKQKAEENEF